MAKPIPDGYASVTPTLTFKDCKKALDFYAKAFGAKDIEIFAGPGGQGIMHATMKIGNSIVMMGDEMPGHNKSVQTMGGSPTSLWIYTENADTLFDRAVKAGAVSMMPVSDMFWGDRMGSLTDPFGYVWSVATHTNDLTKEEVRKNADAFFSKMAGKGA